MMPFQPPLPGALSTHRSEPAHRQDKSAEPERRVVDDGLGERAAFSAGHDYRNHEIAALSMLFFPLTSRTILPRGRPTQHGRARKKKTKKRRNEIISLQTVWRANLFSPSPAQSLPLCGGLGSFSPSWPRSLSSLSMLTVRGFVPSLGRER